MTETVKNFWAIVESSVRDSQNVIPERLYKAADLDLSLEHKSNKSLKRHSKAAFDSKLYIARAAKSLNANYQHAVASIKSDEWRYRKQKCLDRYRASMSRDRFAKLWAAVSALEGEELAEWVVRTEKNLRL